MKTVTLLLTLLVASMTAYATTPTKPYRSTTQIINEAPKSAWYRLDQKNLVYMTLSNGKQVVMELAPRFAPAHANQIRLLAGDGYWDGLDIYRVQDNYVAQFGAFDFAIKKDRKALPKHAKKLPAEFTISAKGLPITRLPDADVHADYVGFLDGFPVAVKDGQAFLVQCYGMVGSARENAPDSSHAGNLYAMIGQPARNLDRQITVVGRVIHGMEHLSSLPRGSGEMGFYAPNETPTVIKSVRMGNALPVSEQLNFEALDTRSQAFLDFVEARRYLQSPWHAAPASGGMGVCEVRQTIRLVK